VYYIALITNTFFYKYYSQRIDIYETSYIPRVKRRYVYWIVTLG